MPAKIEPRTFYTCKPDDTIIRMTKVSVIKDPVHGLIKCTAEVLAIIDHPLFQRLRRTTQLTAVDKVFPGGTHNRFAHSLGVMKVAKKYIKSLLKKIPDGYELNHERDKIIKLTVIAALLHDIAHGPFSHGFEEALKLKNGWHDIHRLKIVAHKSFEPLLKEAGISAQDLIDVWTADIKGDDMMFLIKTIIGGPLGADRMDFIKRDAYHAGATEYGTISDEWIIFNSSLYLDRGKLRLCFEHKMVNNLVHALEGRRLMYERVYLHKTAVAAAILVEKMLELINEEYDLIGMTENIDRFVNLDEQYICGICVSSANSELREVYQRFADRKLPKMLTEELVDVGVEPDVGELEDGLIMTQTRPITGIDPKKFREYGIKFRKKDGTLLTCLQAVQEARTKPCKPYRIVRTYRF